jgi:hypothetical protein
VLLRKVSPKPSGVTKESAEIEHVRGRLSRLTAIAVIVADGSLRKPRHRIATIRSAM